MKRLVAKFDDIFAGDDGIAIFRGFKSGKVAEYLEILWFGCNRPLQFQAIDVHVPLSSLRWLLDLL